MKKTLRVLMIEDLEDDAELTILALQKGGYDPIFERVDTLEAMQAALAAKEWDCIISDYSMPQFNGLVALNEFNKSGIDIPFILVSGTMGEDVAVNAMKAGAHDYIIKGKLARLVPALERELKEAEIRRQRKHIANELRKSEERFRSIYENATIGIYRTTPDGNILLANPALIHMLGYKSFDELAQRNLDDRNNYKQHSRNIFRLQVESEGEIKGFETAWKKKDGSTIFIRESAKVLRDDSGNVLFYDGVIEDITDRQLAIEELRKSEHRLNEAQSIANIGSWELNLLTDKLEWSDESYRIFEIDKSIFKANYTGFLSLVHPEDRVYVDEAYNDSVKNHTNYNIVHRLLFSGERVKFVQEQCETYYDENGKPLRSIGTVQDVTTRKIAEEEIQRLSLVARHTSDIVVITDSKQDIEWVNEAFTNITGYTYEEVKGKKPKLLQGPDTDSHTSYIMKNQISKQLPFTCEILNYKKTGEKYWIEINGQPLFDKNGKIHKWFSVEREITERKKNEEELIKAKDKAEEINRLKSNFLANMSHELRTPMIGILGYSELLVEGIKDIEQNEMIKTINSSGKRLLDTLNELLDISRIEANKQEVFLTNVNINQLLLRFTKIFEASAKIKNLYLKINLMRKDMTALVDKTLFEKIVNNILNNAIKFTNEGGVEITSDIIQRENKNWARIKFKDTGIGVAKKDQTIIFEEFRQASEGYGRSHEGTGLGLAITKKYIQLMNAKLELESEIGKGSTFIIYLPTENEAVLSNDITARRESFPSGEEELKLVHPEIKKAKKFRILSVEDDEVSRNILKLFLKNISEIEFAKNSDEAISLNEENGYDAILLDIGLGQNKSGLDLIVKFKEKYKNKHIPIIAVTAYAMVGDREKFLEAGCTHYISKPFNKLKLVELVKEVLFITNETIR